MQAKEFKVEEICIIRGGAGGTQVVRKSTQFSMIDLERSILRSDAKFFVSICFEYNKVQYKNFLGFFFVLNEGAALQSLSPRCSKIES